MIGFLGAVIAAAVRGAIPGALALAGQRLRRLSAEDRHRLAIVGLVAPWLALLLALSPITPWSFEVPESIGVWVGDAGPSSANARVSAVDSPPGGDAPVLRPASAAPGRGLPIRWLALALWLVPCTVGIVVTARSVALVRRILRAARPDAGLLTRRFASLPWSDSSGRAISVAWSDEVSVPFVWGLRAPVIVLPELARGWGERRLEMILLHELAHVRRRDLFWRRVARLTVAAFWFSPLAWWLARVLAQAAEECCDRCVLARGISASDYAAELVGVVRAMRPVHGFPALSGGGGASRLGHRVQRILGTDLREPRLMAPQLIVGLSAALCGLVRPSLPVAELDGPLDPAPLATGCQYQQGAPHMNRIDAEGTWEVSWRGEGPCAVRFTANQAARAALRSGRLDALDRGTGFAVEVVLGEARTTVLVRAAGEEQVDVSAEGSDPGLVGPSGRAWAVRLIDEIDAHTGFLAERRVPRLIVGGVNAVFERLAALQGDHAALVYLRALVERMPLSPADLRRVLTAAAAAGDNDAAMVSLLDAIRARHPLDGIETEYRIAANTLRSRAAVERSTPQAGDRQLDVVGTIAPANPTMAPPR